MDQRQLLLYVCGRSNGVEYMDRRKLCECKRSMGDDYLGIVSKRLVVSARGRKLSGKCMGNRSGGSWYYFDSNGYMLDKGWHWINGNYYYMYAGGAMASNTWIGDYYLHADGSMATNQWIGNYWVGADGKWVPGKDQE